MFSGSHRLVWWVYLLALLVAAAALIALPWWTVDDAFISYRYGRNLLVHGELTWNPGEHPFVEGYTGIFLPLLSAAILGLGLPLVETLKILGLMVMVGLLAECRRSLQRLGVDPWGQSLAVLFLAITPLLYEHALSGLETIFFTFFITASIGSTIAYRPEEKRSGTSYRLGFCLLLAGLTRPEGIALAGLMAFSLYFSNGFGGFRATKSLLWLSALIVVLLLTCYWAWRSTYYQSLLPNSYYAKVYHGFVNFDSVIAGGKFVGYYCGIPLLGAALLRKVGGRRQPSELGKVSKRIAILFFAVCLATYFHSHLWMNYGSRFFFPMMPIFVIFVTEEVSARWRHWRMKSKETGLQRNGIKTTLCVLAVFQVAVMGFRFVQEGRFLHYYHAIVQEELIPTGQFLALRLPQSAIVISYMDAGAIGYYSGAKVIDFGRLNDPYLARNQLSEADVVKYFFDQNADAVVMTSELRDSLSYIPEANAIAKDPRFKDFRFEKAWGNSAGFPYWQRLYLRVR